MTKRFFPIVSVRRADDGPMQAAQAITCGKCGIQDEIVFTGKTSLPPEATAKKFAFHGWVIGAGPRADRCPLCAKSIVHPKKTELTVVENVPKPHVLRDHPIAEPPREMQRDHRRLIFLKLEEVYLDEYQGYDRGWSDKRVADDMGVPRAWVEKIREENFGPARDNEDVREFARRYSALKSETEALDTRIAGLVTEATRVRDELRDLSKIAEQIRRAVA